MDSEVESLLRTYRKAVRTSDGMGAVAALRKLVEIDKSRDWTPDLVSAERFAQRRLLEKFKAEQSAGHIDASERTARELTDTAWREVPTGHDMDDVRKFVAVQTAKRHETEGREHMMVLRRCHDEWNRALALATLKEIDRLTAEGWNMPQDGRQLADDCRRRCEEEITAEEREKKWHELCERLHGAIQREEIAAIRQILAEPEFLDREPDPELIRAAQLAVRHDEDVKRRKMLLVAGVSLCVLLAVIGLSGLWLKRRNFDERCEKEAVRLAELEKGAHAIERMGNALRALESEGTEILDDPRVGIFKERLQTLVEKNETRTNEIASVLAALRDMQSGGWTSDAESVNDRLNRAKALLTEEDINQSAEWRMLKKSWNDHVASEEEAFRSAGNNLGERIITAVQLVTTRLSEEVHGQTDDCGADKCRSAIESWRAKYATTVPDMDGKIASAEKKMEAAVQMQKHLHAAIARLNGAATAADMIAARQVLTENYADFVAVKNLEPLPMTVVDVQNVLDGSTAEQKAFDSIFKGSIDDTKFKTFIEQKVRVIANIPVFYSLYGLSRRGDRAGELFAVATGKPTIKETVKGRVETRIEGNLLDFGKRMKVEEMWRKHGCSVDPLPLTDEMREVVEIAERTDMTPGQFEQELLRLIDGHLNVAHEKDFVKISERAKNFTSLTLGWYPSYCRIQMLDLYSRWLCDDMKLIPVTFELFKWRPKVATLAAPIKIEGIQDELSWVCRWNARVRQRDVECAYLLAQIPKNWTTNYKEIRSEMRDLRSVGRWHVRTAGIIHFDPASPNYENDPSVVVPVVFTSVSCDHPLYVLRVGNGKTSLKRAFVPHEGSWARTADMGHDYIPGEPLFHVVENDKPLDPEAQVAALSQKLKTSTARRFLDDIPFFSPKTDFKNAPRKKGDDKDDNVEK